MLGSAKQGQQTVRGSMHHVFCMIGRAALFFWAAASTVYGAPTLLGTGLQNGSGSGGDLGTLALDTSDALKTRLHGQALRLDVDLVEMSTVSGTVFRASPTHVELESSSGDKWSATLGGGRLTLYFNDKVVAQVTEDKLITHDLLLDKKQGGQMRVNLCSARAALQGEKGEACG